MPKASSSYICQQCGFKSSQFLGKCPECSSWGSLVETIEDLSNSSISNKRATKLPEVIDLSSLKKQEYPRLSTKLDEFNRVLGGGVVLGSVVLVSGDPGIGKSTLLTQLALSINEDHKSVLYIAGEESAQQIKLRADRIKKDSPLLVVNETNVDSIINILTDKKPSLVIIDSIQTLATDDLTSPAGSISQVRETSHRLQQLAKKLHIPIFIVGHVNKDGSIAGPKTLEHLVDVVLSLEGDTNSQFRILHSAKNRFGPTDEVGIFEMSETGMTEVKNPSQLFLEQKVQAPGSAVVPILTGLRPILVEIQALVTKSFLPVPRRVGSGIDNNRLQLLVAVLTKRLGLPLFDQDIFVNITGGLKVNETAADLGICLAIISSLTNKPILSNVALAGEVGLLGELRNIQGLDKRSTEARKLGFEKMVHPQNTKFLQEAVKIALKQK